MNPTAIITAATLLALPLCAQVPAARTTPAPATATNTLYLEFTLEAHLPTRSSATPAEEDMAAACDILAKRLTAFGITGATINHSGCTVNALVPLTLAGPLQGADLGKAVAIRELLSAGSGLALLPVHPEQERVLADPEVNAEITRYEREVWRSVERRMPAMPAVNSYVFLPGREDDGSATLPRIPARLGLEGYCILPGETDKGYPCYYVVARESAGSITARHVAKAEPDVCRPGCVDITLTPEGTKLMQHLTGGMKAGSDRLAIVIDGQVRHAPTVHGVLGDQFCVSGLQTHETQAIALAMTHPLPVKLLRVETGPARKDKCCTEEPPGQSASARTSADK